MTQEEQDQLYAWRREAARLERRVKELVEVNEELRAELFKVRTKAKNFEAIMDDLATYRQLIINTMPPSLERATLLAKTRWLGRTVPDQYIRVDLDSGKVTVGTQPDAHDKQVEDPELAGSNANKQFSYKCPFGAMGWKW